MPQGADARLTRLGPAVSLEYLVEGFNALPPRETPLPWTCTACDTPCDLVLKDTAVGFKFLSACCTEQARPTRLKDADTP